MLYRATLLTCLALCLCPLVGSGQTDATLAPGFEKLSAKERTRIAREEDQKAREDSAYQMVMRQAEEAFQQQRYEASLELFQQARALRPFNVYPKVKIQDLQALLEKRNAASPQPVQPADPELVQQPASPPDDSVARKPITGQQGAVITPAPVRKDPVVVKPSTPTKDPVPSPSVDLRSGERTFRDGQAVVLERIVPEDQRLVVYRRVTHPSGQVFHFREGLAIDERVWRARFGSN